MLRPLYPVRPGLGMHTSQVSAPNEQAARLQASAGGGDRAPLSIVELADMATIPSGKPDQPLKRYTLALRQIIQEYFTKQSVCRPSDTRSQEQGIRKRREHRRARYRMR